MADLDDFRIQDLREGNPNVTHLLAGRLDVVSRDHMDFKSVIKVQNRCTLWRAIWRRPQRDPKQVLVKQANDSDGAEGLRLEAYILTRKRHSNFITCYGGNDLFEQLNYEEDAHFIVLEYPMSGSLRSIISKVSGNKLGPKQVVDYGIQIIDAICKLHELGYVHRDINLDSLFVRDDNSIALANFGLVARIRTEDEQVWSDASYVAPECHNSNYCDAAQDIYSFGVVMRELSTGSLEQQQIDPTASVNKVATALAKLVQDCTMENPASRPTIQDVRIRLFELSSNSIQHVQQEQQQDVGSRRRIQITTINLIDQLDPYPTNRAKKILNSTLFSPPLATYSWYYESIYGIPKDNQIKMPCRIITQPNAKWFTIISHGNGYDLGGLNEYMLMNYAVTVNSHVLMYEFSGYGVYPGTPTAFNVTQDCLLAYRFVVNVLKWPAHRVILLGHSIGTGPLLEVTRQLALASPSKRYNAPVALVGAFSSCADIISHLVFSFASIFVREPFNNLDALKSISGPVLLVHGKLDRVVPVTQFEKMRDYCARSGLFHCAYEYPKAGHNISLEQIQQCMLKFLDSFVYDNDPHPNPVLDLNLLNSYLPTGNEVVYQCAGAASFLQKIRHLFAQSDAMLRISLTPSSNDSDTITRHLANDSLRIELVAGELQRVIETIPKWLDSLGLRSPYTIDLYLAVLYYLSPFPNVFSEFRALKANIVAADSFSRFFHSSYSAPFGLHHAQLRIGPYLYSWDADCNPFARHVPIWEAYPDPDYPVIQVPDRIYSLPLDENDLRALKQEIDKPTNGLDSFCRSIATKFFAKHNDILPKFATFHQTCVDFRTNNRYSAVANNCQDFYQAALNSTCIRISRSKPMGLHLGKLASGPSFLQPATDVTTLINTPYLARMVTEEADYLMVATRWWLAAAMSGKARLSAQEVQSLLEIHKKAYEKLQK
eukprot:TRINITY_DN5347_c0_g1_i1.p1 TRINITY_DN5347_c0_g1~~TRINITY_DN5347_c0_g1_i1.p1  ORF type:complete len:941 (-),score=153.83 TRINITY_DN5347_c0_g1_i1:198-3020(-)